MYFAENQLKIGKFLFIEIIPYLLDERSEWVTYSLIFPFSSWKNPVAVHLALRPVASISERVSVKADSIMIFGYFGMVLRCDCLQTNISMQHDLRWPRYSRKR